MKIAAIAAALALATPLAALAHTPELHRTVVIHEATRSGPVVTRTAIVHRPVHHRIVVRQIQYRRHHPIVHQKVVYSGHAGEHVTTTTIIRR